MNGKWFGRLILPVALAIVLLVASMLVIPRPAAAQATGPGVDELIFSELPIDQAVQATSVNDIDVFIFTLDAPDDKIAARADPNVQTFEAPSGYNDMLVNPVSHGEGIAGVNPFQYREVREALNWAFDRQFIVNEIFGGFGIPMVGSFFRTTPDWVREAGYYAGLEQKYAYDPQKAMEQVTARFAGVPEITLDSATSKWLFNGVPIQVKVVQRVEDQRFDIGAYVATELNDLGFTAVLDPSTGTEAFGKVYNGPADAGVWHIYTEGWISGGIIQFDDGTHNFFYNGDFGSELWDLYTPPAALQVLCQALEFAEYETLDERQDLWRRCQDLGVEDGVRVFLLATLDMSLAHSSVTDITFDVGTAFNQWFGLKTAQKTGVTGGTLKVAQPIHTISGWNPISGFTWVYEEYQRKHFSDPSIPLDPRLGVGVPFRADFEVETEGPAGTLSVPEDALWFNTTSMAWEAVGSGVEAISNVTLTYTFGKWHHGEDMNMNDIMVSLAEFFRYFKGDLSTNAPSFADESANRFYGALFKAITVDEANDTVNIYFDFWNFDETIIAGFSDWWTTVPWEVHALMAKSSAENDTAVHEDDAEDRGIPQTDLVKGDSLPLLEADLVDLKAANFKPVGAAISDAEATARWAALDQWVTDRGHYYVSNGAFYIDQVTTDPEGTVLKAFRTGYPFDLPTKFADFTSIVVAEVTLGTAPDVIQTFPATFTFATSFEGQPYDRVASTAWLVSDPATGDILFDGAAVRTGPGQWAAEMSAGETTGLIEGSYEMLVVVGTQDSVIPTFASAAFSVQSLQSALLSTLGQEIDDRFDTLQETLDESAAAADSAAESASSAVQLAQIALGIAAAATVVAVVAVVALVVRRRPPA